MSISFCALTYNNLEDVVNVHFGAFPHSALTQLGREAVRRYYEWQMLGPHDAVNIGVFDRDRLLGFCFSGIFRGALGGFLEKNRTFLIRQVVTHPWLMLNTLFRERARLAIRRLYLRFHLPAKAVKVNSPMPTSVPSFGILSIAVAPEHQGSGIAVLLMHQVERNAAERGFSQMNLSVHPSNQRAIRFYEKLGWQRVETEGSWSGHMIKRIETNTSTTHQQN
jgi:ribosomal protein S18 acetylase RimI-like enzyme